MRGLAVAASLLAFLALVPLASSKFAGQGTAYSGPNDKDATGFNACGLGGIGSHWEKYYGAMNSDQFSSDVCGKCVRVRGTESGASGKSFLVKIVDECPTCSHGDVDFSTTALQAITGFSWDRKSISWEWADCSGASDAQGEEQGSGDEEEQDSGDEEQQQQQDDDEEEQVKQDEEEAKKKKEEEEAKKEEEEKQQEEESPQDEQDKGDEEQSPEEQSPKDKPSADAEEADKPKEDGKDKDPAPGKEHPVGTFRDFVVECAEGHRRCANLALASMGYQCMNLKADSCCLQADGRDCKKKDSFLKKVEWDGPRPGMELLLKQRQAAALHAARKAKAGAKAGEAATAAKTKAARAARAAAARRKRQAAASRRMLSH